MLRKYIPSTVFYRKKICKQTHTVQTQVVPRVNSICKVFEM